MLPTWVDFFFGGGKHGADEPSGAQFKRTGVGIPVAGHILWFIFRFYGLSHASGEEKSAGLATGEGLGLPA